MQFQIITLFPDILQPALSTSMMRKAAQLKLAQFSCIQLRDYGIGPRRAVDDVPYGGGDGMLLKPEPLFAAVEHAKANDPDAEVLIMTPKGEQFDQAMAQNLASNNRGKIIICGRYEGYDERILTLVDRQISLGNFVLTGGEIPALAIIDAVARLIPGVLGGELSAHDESFSGDNPELLEYPHYTRPEEFRGMRVPEVLLSGNHAEIAKWRQKNRKAKNSQQEN